ncbi:YfhO family protein [Gilvibacter sp.]|uniref:YfhO family protein n=1 Tax=Gilvibacter sp. TaxID=2729997 RepID=UPI003F4A701F
MAALKKALPHLIVLILFVLASLIYFSPVLQGDTIFQSDIAQFNGIAKQQRDFKAATGEETYWTNGAFGGMPTYQIGARYPNHLIKKLDLTLRFLPRPADYLFLYLLSMYVLLLVMKVDYKLAFLGALAFGFSTYLIIILGVGHNLKAHAIAYMPLVLAGIILTFRRKYLWGFALTAIAMGLELVANHFQMTYYLLILVVVLGIAYLIDAILKKQLQHFTKSVLILCGAVLLAIGFNSANILATAEYAPYSMRGKSELTIKPDGTPKEVTNGLSYDYITEYSYGKLESFNLMVPRFMGGGSGEPLPEESELIETLRGLPISPEDANNILRQVPLPMYWGQQPIIEAPAYVGAIVVFLALLGFFLIKGRLRWWLLGGIILSLLLSWGKNFAFLTEFFVDYVPLYNKFRAVSSMQVIIELLLPIAAVIGLHQLFNDFNSKESRKKALLLSGGIVSGLLLIFYLFGSSLFDFEAPYDADVAAALGEIGPLLIEGIQADRFSVFKEDSLRSLGLVVASFAVLFALMRQMIKEPVAVGILAVLIVVDLVGVDKRYVNEDDFVDSRVMEQPYQANGADLQIQKDTDGFFRVYDMTSAAFTSGRASFFHNALGGYSAVKMGRINDINHFYLMREQPNMNIINMFNVRYLIRFGDNGGPFAQRNPGANGNSWFVSDYEMVNSADEEIQALADLDTKRKAVVHSDFAEQLSGKRFTVDSTATISLKEFAPNRMVYTSNSSQEGLAVFSEMYYKPGWKLTVDGQDADYFRANYTLRAMVLPAGSHEIVFSFEPEVVQRGSLLSLVSATVFILILLGFGYMNYRKSDREAA